jgi:ketosteroid isomerase-like protein
MMLWEKYFNERDAEKLAQLYHEQASALQIAIGLPLLGRRAILEDSRQFFGNIPDNFTTVFNRIESGTWVAIEWTGGGTFVPTGKKFEFRGCGFFEIVDGLIKTQRGYWDMLQWQKAVGV